MAGELRLTDSLGPKRERRRRFIPRLNLQMRVIDRGAVNSRACPGFEPADPETELTQMVAQAHRSEIARTARRVVALANVDQTLQKGPGREDHGPSLEYLANLLTAGRTAPITAALERMLAMRAYMRAKTVDGVIIDSIAERVGLSGQDIEDMYQLMAIANYEDRFVIPTTHREEAENAYALRGNCGFSFGNGCDAGEPKSSLFGGKMGRRKMAPIRLLDN